VELFVENAYGDFIDDGINAVLYLTKRDDVVAEAVGLLGSSEGAAAFTKLGR
jgi:hypothetical protein